MDGFQSPVLYENGKLGKVWLRSSSPPGPVGFASEIRSPKFIAAGPSVPGTKNVVTGPETDTAPVPSPLSVVDRVKSNGERKFEELPEKVTSMTPLYTIPALAAIGAPTTAPPAKA